MTRAKDISKIVTDADLSGTLDVTGTITVGDGHTIGDDGSDNLEIATSVGENLILASSGNVNTFLDTNEDQSTASFQIHSGTTSSTHKLLRVEETGDISFYEDTGTTPKLFWDASAESLGIGTSSPNSQITLKQSAQNFAGGLRFIRSDNTNNFAFAIDGNTKLNIAYNDSTKLVIDSSGNVGIGTSSPSVPSGTALEIYGSSASRLKLSNSTTGTGSTDGFQIYTTGSSAILEQKENAEMRFYTNATERMRIKSDGALEFQAATDNVIKTNSNSSRIRIFGGSTASVGNGGALTLNGASHSTGNYVDLASATSGFITFRTGTTERLRISSAGNLLFRNTTDNFNIPSGHNVLFNSGATYLATAHQNGTGSGAGYHSFVYNSGQIGSITQNGTTGVSYNTSSDHRLKENVTADWDATTRLKQLNPVRFNFIADADTTVDGFLAHEVQSVVPEAITGTHNEVDDDGNPVYQGIDQSKLVPLLVKTIQELEARIVALETA